MEEKVPVPNQTCKPVDYKYLLDMQKQGIEQFLPEGGEEQVSVAWLLEGIETPRPDLYARRERREPEPQAHRPAAAQPVAAGSGAAAAPALAPKTQPEQAETPPPVPSGKSPWSAGSFYLFVVVVVSAMLAVGLDRYGLTATLGIAAAAVLVAFFVYAAQLKHDDKLSEASYTTLMGAALKKLNPFGGDASNGS